MIILIYYSSVDLFRVVGKLFPPVEEEIEKSIESRKSGQDEDEEKLAGPDTVTDSAIDNVNESEVSFSFIMKRFKTFSSTERPRPHLNLNRATIRLLCCQPLSNLLLHQVMTILITLKSRTPIFRLIPRQP